MDEVATPTMRTQRPIAGPKSTKKENKKATFSNVLDSLKKKKTTNVPAKE